MVLLATVLVPVTALAVSANQTAIYEASARVLLKQGSIVGELLGTQLQASSNPSDREVETQAQLAHVPAVAQRVLAATPLKGEPVQELLRHSTVTPDPNADILDFSVRDADPHLALRLANEYAHQYTLYRQRLDTLPIDQAVADARRQMADLGTRGSSNARAALARRVGELQTQRALHADSASIVDPALSARKAHPQMARTAFAGLLLGALFGVGLAFLWEALDTRLRSSDEISDGLDLPLLARVPANPQRFGPDTLPVMMSEPQGPEAEAFRSLRASLDFVNLEVGARSIMVTSAHPGEGKSSVAANLAVALARAGRRVTLVDLDLRKPSLARYFRLYEGSGLTDVALGSASLDEALTTIRTHEPVMNGKRNGNAPRAGGLRVLTSGPTPPDAGEFYTTLALESILQRVRGTSELVLIDCPPLLNVGDAVTLSSKVDAILLVTRSSVLRRPALAELRRVLASCPAEKLGFVLTETQLDEWAAGGGYHNGRSFRPARDRLTTS